MCWYFAYCQLCFCDTANPLDKIPPSGSQYQGLGICDDQYSVLQVLQEITSVWDVKRGRATDGASPAKRRSTSGSGAPSEAERRKSRENEMAEIADIDGTFLPVDMF